MKNHLPTYLAGLALAPLLTLASCVSVDQAAPPVERLAAAKPATTPKLVQGRKIYLSACVKCHSVEPVNKHSAEEWRDDILPTMCKKAKLAQNDADAVRAYVFAALGPVQQPSE